MNKFFKSLFVIGGTALAAHFGLKAYKRVNGIVKLAKSLPEFLNNVYGDMPKVNINNMFGHIVVKVYFSQEMIDKHPDIEKTTREYIDDFYPELSKCTLEISVLPLGEETEEEDSFEGEGEEAQEEVIPEEKE